MQQPRPSVVLGIALTVFAMAVMFSSAPSAQLQQSGGPGSTVTVGTALPSGANVIGKVSIDQTTPGTTNLVSIGTTGTVAINAALPAGGNTIGTVNVGTFPALSAGTNTIGVVVPKTPCGTTVFSQPIVAVPTSTGSPTSTTTCVMRAYFNNTNASAQTVTLTDNSGTPLNSVGPAFSIPGLSNVVIPFDGIVFTSGVKWVAGGTGVTGALWGFQ